MSATRSEKVLIEWWPKTRDGSPYIRKPESPDRKRQVRVVRQGKGAASTLTTCEAFLSHSGQRDSQPVGGFGSPPSDDDNDCLRRFQRVSDDAPHQSGAAV